MPRLVHLSRREADIVISLERPARGPVVVAKLSDYVLRLYASKAVPGRSTSPIRTRDDLRGHTFISYVDDLLFSKELQYLDELYQPRLLRAAQHQHPGAAPGHGRRAPASRCCRPSSRSATSALRPVLPGRSELHAHVLDVGAGGDAAPGADEGGWDFLRETVEARRDILVAAGVRRLKPGGPLRLSRWTRWHTGLRPRPLAAWNCGRRPAAAAAAIRLPETAKTCSRRPWPLRQTGPRASGNASRPSRRHETSATARTTGHA